MKTILYATDFSRQAVAALRLAYLMSENFNCKLIVMHVFSIPITLSTVSVSHINKEKRLLSENHSKLRDYCTRYLGEIRESSNIDFVVEENVSITDGIIGKAIEFDADLITVGTKGASAIKEFLLGSTTKGLIKKASCTVLSVPEMSRTDSFKTMVYATDFEQADIFAIKKLEIIASIFDAQIRIVHISSKEEYAGDQQMEWFKGMLQQNVRYGKITFDLIFSDQIFEELNGYLDKSEANLLAMLERKDNSFLQRYLRKDLVQKMVSNIAIPLLSFNTAGL
ncbi:universal stress protein [Arenibacter sp. N53]|uniref:universal stress protein n=1 Tax=Arenibacter TaxID=178469 RepID=UPI000CD418B3|nr:MULTISPECIES: universal stress protein [Arenibacter]MCM4151200.1 universal stress protein [Arenibacter sp. N53]